MENTFVETACIEQDIVVTTSNQCLRVCACMVVCVHCVCMLPSRFVWAITCTFCPWISELRGARIPQASAISCCIKNTKSMKYRSLWPTFSLRSNSGHIHLFIQNFHVALKVQGKITGS